MGIIASYHAPKPQRLCTLYFFRHADCDVCKVAEPILDAWWVRTVDGMNASAKESGMPASHALWVVKLDTTHGGNDTVTDTSGRARSVFSPNGTPAYYVTVDGQEVYRVVGGLREKDLDKLWGRILKES